MVWAHTGTIPLQTGGGGIVPRGSRVEVFQQIYWVFLALGVLVGVVVIGYMVYNAYKYRHRDGEVPVEKGDDHPELGEVPTGGGKGGKLFLSLTLSAIIVVSLIGWTYGTLLYVEEDSPVSGDAEHLTVEVEGYQFGWSFTYPNGHETGTLRVPANTAVELRVTSRDVFHNFGIPQLNVKTDAVPGQTTDTWFVSEGPASYTVNCYELCGVGHSYMKAPVEVMPADDYRQWYANTNGTNATNASSSSQADITEATT
ncbi:cytochrome c oxidase subunit II [Halorarius halobius]|uniref:cytochrome c oxidase subunit II n=1 Tax=Halorarius halobius TaxID=2962671 RepID=UPI0020CD1D78|nr:cytochrome c oxidase subunit II [Halorarius halobius]